jgi:WD40 repeat protein
MTVRARYCAAVRGDLSGKQHRAAARAFANFGFAESHSISFALLVYSFSWFRLHYPAAFLAARDARTGKLRHTLPGHVDTVWSAALSVDGKIGLTVGTVDNSVAVWDIATGRLMRSLSGHDGGVTAVVLTAVGAIGVSVGRDDSIRVSNTATGGCLRTLASGADGLQYLALSDDGHMLLSIGPHHSITSWYLDWDYDLD